MSSRQKLIEQYAKLKIQHEKVEENLQKQRQKLKELENQTNKKEGYIESYMSTAQMIGEITNKQSEERYLVKVLSGQRYVVGVESSIPKEQIKVGSRVTLDMNTMTIMKVLKRQVDPLVYKMLTEDPGNVSFDEIGGLTEQMKLLREAIELPITNPELFKRVGIAPPKGVLLYGPPGTGKTLLARALASNVKANFMKVVASSIMNKYIGESASLIREMFTYAKLNQPCIIFIDEIDAIGGKRLEGSSSDREIQRTLMELLSQMDGFDTLGQVKTVMATNRPDILDPALLRPGRLDRKIEIGLPNDAGRLEILKIHARKISIQGAVDFEGIAKICEGFNGADLRNVCTEAGMFAIREDRDYVIEQDFFKGARKIKDVKKIETKLNYVKVQ